nr:GIDE domain-containing protein [Motiliproteus sp. SC1-56]
MSQVPCVWYQYKVQRYRKSGKHGRWQTVRQGSSEQWFQIDDDSDTCIVDPEAAEVITEHSRTWYGHSEYPAKSAHGGLSLLSLSAGGSRYRYREKFIHRHDVIYALGHLQTVGGGRQLPGHREQTGEVIREWKQDYRHLLKQFDRNRDGEIDLKEWEMVRQAAQHEAAKRRGKLAEVPTMHVLSRPPNRHYPFILSTRSQKYLARRFRYSAGGALGGLLACGGFAIALLS